MKLADGIEPPQRMLLSYAFVISLLSLTTAALPFREVIEAETRKWDFPTLTSFQAPGDWPSPSFPLPAQFQRLQLSPNGMGEVRKLSRVCLLVFAIHGNELNGSLEALAKLSWKLKVRKVVVFDMTNGGSLAVVPLELGSPFSMAVYSSIETTKGNE